MEEPVLDLERLPAALKLAIKTTQSAFLGFQKAAASWALGVSCGMTRASIKNIGEECQNASRKSAKASDCWDKACLLMGDKHHDAAFIALDIINVSLAWSKTYLQLLEGDAIVSFIVAFKAFEETIEICDRTDFRMTQIALAFPELKVAEVPAVASTAPFLTKNVTPLLGISEVSGYVWLTSNLKGCFA
jgi:hypothetical protein